MIANAVMSETEIWQLRQDQDFQNPNPFFETGIKTFKTPIPFLRLGSRLSKCHSLFQDWDQDFQNTNPFFKTGIKTFKILIPFFETGIETFKMSITFSRLGSRLKNGKESL